MKQDMYDYPLYLSQWETVLWQLVIDVQLTITSAIIARESFEVCGFKPRVIIIESTHHARPGARKHEEAFSRSFDDTSTVIQQDWLHAEKGEGLETEIYCYWDCFYKFHHGFKYQTRSLLRLYCIFSPFISAITYDHN